MKKTLRLSSETIKVLTEKTLHLVQGGSDLEALNTRGPNCATLYCHPTQICTMTCP